jgi:ATP-binding cassette, subfamily B, bacterial
MSGESNEETDERPMLSAEVPTSVKAALDEDGSPTELQRILLKADLGPDGQFGEQWLLLDDRDLRVVERHNGTAHIRYKYPLDRIQSARIERCVGNGLLEVTVDDQPRVLLHYTNELTDRFGRIAHYLTERATLGEDAELPDPYAVGNVCQVCGRPLVDPSAKVCPRCVQRGKTLKRLAQLARPYWGSMAAIVGLLIVGTLLDLTPPYLTRILIDDVLSVNGRPDWLLYVVLGLLVVTLVRVASRVLINRLTVNVSARFTAGIRDQLFSHLKVLPIDFFDKNQIGRLMTRINQDTDELQGLVAQMTSFALNILLVVGIGIVLFTMAPSLGLYVLIPTPFVIGAAYYYYRYMRPHFKRMWLARWRLNAMLNTYLSGVRVVKAFAQEELEERRYQDRNHRLLDTRLQVDLAWSRFFPLVSFAFSVGGLIIWYTGGNAVLSEEITLGTLMAFVSYLGMFYAPLSNLTQISQSLNRFATISQRTFELLDEEPQAQPSQPVRKARVGGRIQFDNVTFGYDPYYPVIRDFSYAIEPGEMVGVVGHSGAGKTTLVNLICRFYDVQRGAIRIDGIDIRDLEMQEIRQQVGIVLQKPFLFRGTLAENIAYAKPDATREEIVTAAKAANAHGFITMLPEGYDTIVGEGGAGLSGGELQRVSIARAILHNPSILILDEATSSVDTDTERQIQQALDTLVQGRTTIAIAHRLSTLYNADRIMVLNHGRLAEEGPPKRLMDNRGLFYNLVKMQSEFATLEGVPTL